MFKVSNINSQAPPAVIFFDRSNSFKLFFLTNQICLATIFVEGHSCLRSFVRICPKVQEELTSKVNY